MAWIEDERSSERKKWREARSEGKKRDRGKE